MLNLDIHEPLMCMFCQHATRIANWCPFSLDAGTGVLLIIYKDQELNKLNLLKGTIHSGDTEIAIDRWLLIAECKWSRKLSFLYFLQPPF